MLIRISALFAALVFFAGCSFPPLAQNPDEYRKQVKSMPGKMSHYSYVVNRPFNKVTNVVKKKAQQCLRKKFTRTNCTKHGFSTNCQDYHTYYMPKTKGNSKKMVLTMQMRIDNAIHLGGKPPPKDGFYSNVIDFEPAGKKKTKITVYTVKDHYNHTPNAVKHWAKGTNMGCPKLDGM
ncbi:MAG: hypothetical protein OEY00_07110 [Gammaproteobacteria bacterium]|nr:hypothetical protein [Gammaproteobacteria bacterium]